MAETRSITEASFTNASQLQKSVRQHGLLGPGAILDARRGLGGNDEDGHEEESEEGVAGEEVQPTTHAEFLPPEEVDLAREAEDEVEYGRR
jgi:hypothetical protein